MTLVSTGQSRARCDELSDSEMHPVQSLRGDSVTQSQTESHCALSHTCHVTRTHSRVLGKSEHNNTHTTPRARHAPRDTDGARGPGTGNTNRLEYGRERELVWVCAARGAAGHVAIQSGICTRNLPPSCLQGSGVISVREPGKGGEQAVCHRVGGPRQRNLKQDAFRAGAARELEDEVVRPGRGRGA